MRSSRSIGRGEAEVAAEKVDVLEVDPAVRVREGGPGNVCGWRRWRSLRRRIMMELERATGEEARGKVVFLSVFRLKSNIIIVVVSSSILP